MTIKAICLPCISCEEKKKPISLPVLLFPSPVFIAFSPFTSYKFQEFFVQQENQQDVWCEGYSLV